MGTSNWIKATSTLLCASITLSACAPHVQLPAALPRSAPTQARLAQYQAFRPLQVTTVISGGQNGSGVHSQVQLANGLNVYFAEDLLPLAGLQSPTAQNLQSAQTLDSVSTGTSIAGIVLMGLGLGLMFGGSSAFRWSGDTALTAGVATMSVGALLGVTGGITRYVAGWQRRDAFMSFDESFRGNLGLCLSGAGVADCAPSPLPINSAPPVSGAVTVSPLSRAPISTPVPMLRF